jgi:hypothetical protein
MRIRLYFGLIEDAELAVGVAENVSRPSDDMRQPFAAIGPENIKT